VKPQPTNEWCILESKSAALAAAVFVDFPESKCYFFAQKQASGLVTLRQRL